MMPHCAHPTPGRLRQAHWNDEPGNDAARPACKEGAAVPGEPRDRPDSGPGERFEALLPREFHAMVKPAYAVSGSGTLPRVGVLPRPGEFVLKGEGYGW